MKVLKKDSRPMCVVLVKLKKHNKERRSSTTSLVPFFFAIIQ